MSDKAVITGLLSLVDEATGTTVFSYKLEDIQAAITGLQESSKIEIQLQASETDLALNLGGVVTPKIFLIYIKSGDGPITIKHDSNTNPVTIEDTFILFGSITSVTVTNPDAVAKTIEYFVAG
jgi:hypothetical protein